MSSQIALMIDADNVSYKYVNDIFQHLARHGDIVLKAAYGNWQNQAMASWHEVAEMHNFKVRPSGSKTNNSSDMQLIIDTMDILRFRSEIDIFCIVSNDADYIPLCRKLRKSKKHIIGIGTRLAATELIFACDQFIFVGPKPATKPLSIKASKKTISRVSAIIKPRNTADLRELISIAFSQLPNRPGAWVKLSALGNALRKVKTGFQNKHYGHSSLSKLLQSLPDLVEVQTQGSVKFVRLVGYSNPVDLREIVQEAFESASETDKGWVTLSNLGVALREVQPDFSSKYYGYNTLSKLLESMPDFVELKGKAETKSARLIQ